MTPRTWLRVRVDDVASIERDTVLPEDIATGTNYVGLEHINSDGNFVGVSHVASGELASNKFRFGPKHILFGKLRPYLKKTARPDFDGICSTDIVPILPGPRVDRGFLFHFLRHPKTVEEAILRCAGANLPRLSPRDLEALELPLPPLTEQRRIADILDRADALRHKRREAIALTEQLLRSVFLEMFGDSVANPKRWPVVELSAVVVDDGPQNGLYRPSSDYGSGTPILRIDSFYDGEVVELAGLKRVRIEPGLVAKSALRENDIVVNRVNSRKFLGKSALVPNLAEPTVFESNMMRMTLDSAVVHPRFVVEELQQPNIRRQIDTAAKDAVNQSSINQGDVSAFGIRLPPLKLQAKFARAAEAVRRGLGPQLQAHDQAAALFDSLAQIAFKGD